MEKSSAGKEAELLSEIRRLKEQSQKDKAELEKALEKAKEVNAQKIQKRNSAHFINALTVRKLWVFLYRSPLQSAESSGKMVVDHGSSQELQEANARLRERLVRMVKHTD